MNPNGKSDPWPARRAALLTTRICDLGLTIRGGRLEGLIEGLYGELSRKGIRFHPSCYLSTAWGCPDRVPLIGIPFHLADRDLSRLEREMGFDVDSPATIRMLLRHEAGHAINYAYALWERDGWEEVFGPFAKCYRDHYLPNPLSRDYVLHCKHFYAQKHPDEDFAETFAVWLTPGLDWKGVYAGGGAHTKLGYVDVLMREAGPQRPGVRGGDPDVPVEDLECTLREYYGADPLSHRRKTRASLDGILRKVFPEKGGVPVAAFFRRHEGELIERVSFWTGLFRPKVERIVAVFRSRAVRLGLRHAPKRENRTLVEVTSLITIYVLNYIHTKNAGIL